VPDRRAPFDRGRAHTSRAGAAWKLKGMTAVAERNGACAASACGWGSTCCHIRRVGEGVECPVNGARSPHTEGVGDTGGVGGRRDPLGKRASDVHPSRPVGPPAFAHGLAVRGGREWGPAHVSTHEEPAAIFVPAGPGERVQGCEGCCRPGTCRPGTQPAGSELGRL
jgi:hypothetical protein